MVAQWALLYLDNRRQARAGCRPVEGRGPAEGILPLRGLGCTLR